MRAAAIALAVLGCTRVTTLNLKIDPAEAHQIEEHERLTALGLGFDPRVCSAPPDPARDAILANLSPEPKVEVPKGDPFLDERCRIARMLDFIGEPVLSDHTTPLSVRLIEETANGWRVVRLAAATHGAWVYVHSREGGVDHVDQRAIRTDRWNELVALARRAFADGPTAPGAHLILELANRGEYRVTDTEEPSANLQSLARELERFVAP